MKLGYRIETTSESTTSSAGLSVLSLFRFRTSSPTQGDMVDSVRIGIARTLFHCGFAR